MARTTQRDLANRLGFSQATVSAVLNNSTSIKISDKTREKILKEAEKGSYWPNRLANALLERKTKTIGVAYSSGYSQVMMRKLYAVVSAIEEAGYFPIVHDLVSDISGERTCQFFRDVNVDGVVLLNVMRFDFLERSYPKYLEGVIPAISIDTPRKVALAQFNSDRRQGFRLVAEHLVSLGYRKFAVLGTPLPPVTGGLSFYHAYGLVHGVGDALEAAGLEPATIEYHHPSAANLHNPHLGGEMAMEKLLSAGHRPEVVVCSNDSWAIGAMAVCAKWGLRIPEDIAVTGFQNEIQSQYTLPPLTTINAPAEELSSRAVEYLVSHLEDPDHYPPPARRIILPCQLVVRQSCGAHWRSLAAPIAK